MANAITPNPKAQRTDGLKREKNLGLVPDPMGDLKQPRWMYLKAVLLLAIGLVASTLILLESPRAKTLLYLTLAIWGFCRAYYFAFYVIEHYIDPGYKFDGLISAVRFVWNRRSKRDD